MYFAHRDKGYMERPEKRGSYNRNASDGGKKPGNRRHGNLYGVIALIVSVILR